MARCLLCFTPLLLTLLALPATSGALPGAQPLEPPQPVAVGGGDRHWGYRYGYRHRPYYDPFYDRYYSRYYAPYYRGYYPSPYRDGYRHYLPDDAVRVVIGGQEYFLSDGVYYRAERGYFTVVQPPAGTVVDELPAGYRTVDVNGESYFERAGTWYRWEQAQHHYRIIDDPHYTAPPASPEVLHRLPPEASEETINGIKYWRYQQRYYLPALQRGRRVYVEVSP